MAYPPLKLEVVYFAISYVLNPMSCDCEINRRKGRERPTHRGRIEIVNNKIRASAYFSALSTRDSSAQIS